MISSLEDLFVVPLSRLLLHEAHDGSRLSRLAGRIGEEGFQRHPVIIFPQEENYLVLDGAHRVQALKNLGCEFVLTQRIDLPEKAESWGHVLSIPGRSKLYGLESVEVSSGHGDGEHDDARLAGIEFAAGEYVSVTAREPGLAGEVRGLWELQKLYPGGGVVTRVEPGATVELAGDESIVFYRSFTLEELAEVVRSGAVLPAGITRFRARERILGVRFPLEKLRDGSLEGRNEELRAFVEERRKQNRVRYYAEPVVLFE